MSLRWLVAQSLYTRACWKPLHTCLLETLRKRHAQCWHPWLCGTANQKRTGQQAPRSTAAHLVLWYNRQETQGRRVFDN